MLLGECMHRIWYIAAALLGMVMHSSGWFCKKKEWTG